MSVTETSAAVPAESTGPSRRVKIGLAGLLLGMFLGMMDSFIVSTALPTIVGELGGLTSLAWTITAYTLATAASTQVWGKLGDLYNRKTVFLLSVVMFLAGSMLCGLAQNMGQLIAFRTLQGIAAGGLAVGALSIINVLLSRREATKVTTWVALLMGTSFIGGPVIGGVLTDAFSWRWIFYVNLPFGILCIAATVIGVRNTTPAGKKPRIDYLGTVLLTVGIVALTLATSWADTKYAWGSVQIVGLFAVAAASLVAFVLVERRESEPILPLRMFHSGNFTLAQILGFLFGAALVAAVSFMPLYEQNVRGVSAIDSGLLLFPMMLGMVVLMMGGSKIVRKTGRYRVFPIIGGAAITVGMVLLLLLETETNTLLGSLYPIPIGIGLGCLIQNTVLITRSSVQPRDMGAAMGVGTLARMMGTAVGLAVLGSVYAREVSSSLTDRLGPAADPLLGSGSRDAGPELISRLSGPVRDAWAAASTDGLHAVAVGGVIIGVVTFVAAWFVREVPLTDPFKQGPPPSAPAAAPAPSAPGAVPAGSPAA